MNRISLGLCLVLIAIVAATENKDANNKRIAHYGRIPGHKSPSATIILHSRPDRHAAYIHHQGKREPTTVNALAGDIFSSRFGKEASGTYQGPNELNPWRLGREAADTYQGPNQLNPWRLGREADSSQPISEFDGERKTPDAPIPFYYTFNEGVRELRPWNMFGKRRMAHSGNRLPINFFEGRKRDSTSSSDVPYFVKRRANLPTGRRSTVPFFVKKSTTTSNLPMMSMFSKKSTSPVPFYLERRAALPMGSMFSRSASLSDVPYFEDAKRDSNNLPMGIFSREKDSSNVPFFVKRSTRLPMASMFSRSASSSDVPYFGKRSNGLLPMGSMFSRSAVPYFEDAKKESAGNLPMGIFSRGSRKANSPFFVKRNYDLPMGSMFSRKRASGAVSYNKGVDSNIPMKLGLTKRRRGGYPAIPSFNWGPARSRRTLPMQMFEGKRHFSGFRPVVSNIVQNERNRKLKINADNSHFLFN